jgi:hypothetical protein
MIVMVVAWYRRFRQSRKHLQQLVKATYEKHRDPSTGEAFYYNRISGASTWQRPLLLFGSDLPTTRKEEAEGAGNAAAGESKSDSDASDSDAAGSSGDDSGSGSDDGHATGSLVVWDLPKRGQRALAIHSRLVRDVTGGRAASLHRQCSPSSRIQPPLSLLPAFRYA